MFSILERAKFREIKYTWEVHMEKMKSWETHLESVGIFEIITCIALYFPCDKKTLVVIQDIGSVQELKVKHSV
jgi:hypothetical protein